MRSDRDRDQQRLHHFPDRELGRPVKGSSGRGRLPAVRRVRGQPDAGAAGQRLQARHHRRHRRRPACRAGVAAERRLGQLARTLPTGRLLRHLRGALSRRAAGRSDIDGDGPLGTVAAGRPDAVPPVARVPALALGLRRVRDRRTGHCAAANLLAGRDGEEGHVRGARPRFDWPGGEQQLDQQHADRSPEPGERSRARFGAGAVVGDDDRAELPPAADAVHVADAKRPVRHPPQWPFEHRQCAGSRPSGQGHVLGGDVRTGDARFDGHCEFDQFQVNSQCSSEAPHKRRGRRRSS